MMVDWLQDPPKEPSAEEEAFDNMFNYYVSNAKTLNYTLIEFYKQHGVAVKDSQIVFDSPAHRTMFLLRWL